jgi:hypothetical protein
MQIIHKFAAASAIAFSALAFIVLPGSTAEARPVTRPDAFCLAYGEGGTDCGFTSYAQCQATASGQDAECYGPVRDDEGFYEPGGGGYEARAQATGAPTDRRGHWHKKKRIAPVRP